MSPKSTFPVPALPPAIRVCRQCGQQKAAAEFIFTVQMDDNQLPLCLDCHKTSPLVTAAERTAKESVDKWRESIKAMVGITASTITDLNNALIGKYGSLEKFADFYYKQIQTAATNHPGSKTVLDACVAITKIIVASTAYQASLPPLAGLTDKELAEEINRLVMEQIDHIPAAELRRITQERERVESA